MPTSGNQKSGDSLFCITPQIINDQSLPLTPTSAPTPDKYNSIQSLIYHMGKA